MLLKGLTASLLQQCSTATPQLPGLCWMALARLSAAADGTLPGSSTSSSASAAAENTQASNVEGAAAAAAADQEKIARQRRRLARAQLEQHLHSIGFDDVHSFLQQQFSLQSSQSDARLLLLINKAESHQQLSTAVDVVRTNHMKKGRIHQVGHCTPAVFSQLLKASQRLGMPHTFLLELLQQANQLGLSVSRKSCEHVVSLCLKQKDYPAASMAWLYAKLYLAGQSTSGSGSINGTADTSSHEQQDVAAVASAESASEQAAWASKSMIRLYIGGLTQWLAAGAISKRQQRQLTVEIAQLSQELQQRSA